MIRGFVELSTCDYVDYSFSISNQRNVNHDDDLICQSVKYILYLKLNKKTVRPKIQQYIPKISHSKREKDFFFWTVLLRQLDMEGILILELGFLKLENFRQADLSLNNLLNEKLDKISKLVFLHI